MPAKPEVWTEEKLTAMTERYAKEGAKALAEEWGMSQVQVVAKARRMGLATFRKKPPKDFRWTAEMEAKIRDRYTAEGGEKLASEFGVSLHTLRRKAASLKVYTIAGHARAGEERAARSDACDIRYFDTWSPDMAYVLGFLFADGSIDSKKTCVRILLSDKDQQVLWFIKKCLRSRHPVRTKQPAPDPRMDKLPKKQCLLILSSTVLVRSLAARGMHPRKTYNDDPFPDVPDDMLPHFVRGLFDGDGCAHVSGEQCSLSFVGSVTFMDTLKTKLVDRLGLVNVTTSVRQGERANYATISWSSSRDVLKLYGFMYPEGHGFCLDRKKSKLTDWAAKDIHTCARWEEFDDECIRRFYNVLPVPMLAGLLGRSNGVLKARARELGVAAKRK